MPLANQISVIRFDYTRYFTIDVSEEFVDCCSENALSIEVWGHRRVQPQKMMDVGANQNTDTSVNNE